MVSPSEGNEARREGRRESHISIVPSKQGNLYRGDPGEGRGMSVMDPWGGNPMGALSFSSGSTPPPRTAKCAGPNCSRTFAELRLYEFSPLAVKFTKLFGILESEVGGVRLRIKGKSEVMPLRKLAKFRR